MSDSDKFNYECEGQVSLFDVFDEKTLNGICHTKPAVGKSLVLHYKGKDYPCIVNKHCGYDFFHIEFTDRQPSDDFPEVKKNTGWHQVWSDLYDSINDSRHCNHRDFSGRICNAV